MPHRSLNERFSSTVPVLGRKRKRRGKKPPYNSHPRGSAMSRKRKEEKEGKSKETPNTMVVDKNRAPPPRELRVSDRVARDVSLHPLMTPCAQALFRANRLTPQPSRSGFATPSSPENKPSVSCTPHLGLHGE